jgi:hypothetical protein
MKSSGFPQFRANQHIETNVTYLGLKWDVVTAFITTEKGRF